MSRKKRYTKKGKKKRPKDEDDEARQRKILRQIKMTGRIPTPPPGHYHDTGPKQRRRQDRQAEKRRLRNLTQEKDHG
jgi:hypothetical protein